MAMGKCRECGKEVSSKAKTCPHCGVKKPFTPTFKDMPKWQQWFVVLTLGPVILIVVASVMNRENALLKEVKALPDSQLEEKYEGYLALYEMEQKGQYRNKVLEYGKEYLKEIPVTDPVLNLEIYENLADIDSSNDYTGKINLYSFMVSVSTDCAIAAEELSQNALNNRSTYENKPIKSQGHWESQNRYVYRHQFEGANSFGVVKELTAIYACETNPQTGEYNLKRVSMTSN